MLGALVRGHGSAWRITRPTGKREAMRLPKRLRAPSLPGTSTAEAKNTKWPGNSRRSASTWFLAVAAGQVGEAEVDLLQAEDVGIGDAPRFVRDARRIDGHRRCRGTLDVPGDEVATTT